MRLPGPGSLAPAFAATALAALPGQARADIECRFETECHEGETCVESGFAVTLETALVPGTVFAEGGFPAGDRAVTDAGSAEIGWAASGPALAAFWSSRSGFHMLSFDAEGVARYSAHLPEAAHSVLHVGTCGTR